MSLDEEVYRDHNISSDEPVDPCCEICVAKNNRRIRVVGLCKECSAFVCHQCLRDHWRWPGMRYHQILLDEDMPRSQAEKLDLQLVRVNQSIHALFLIIYISLFFILKSYTEGTYFWNITLSMTSSLDAKLPQDWLHRSGINGMVINTDGTLLLADNVNTKVKAFTQNGQYLASLTVYENPYSIALISSTAAVVSTSALWINKLRVLNICDSSGFSELMSVSVDNWITGLIPSNNNLIIISSTSPVSVKMVGIYGNEIWSTSLDRNGQKLFQSPTHLATQVIRSKATVIVTDSGRDTITLLDADNGEVIRTIDVKGKGPMGLAVDSSEYIYICYSKTSEISVWQPDFSRSRILLAGSQLRGQPRDIVYAHATTNIFISYIGSSVVDRFANVG